MTAQQVDLHVETARRTLERHAWDAPRVEDAWQKLGLRRVRDETLRRRTAMVGGSALALAAIVALVILGWRALRPGTDSTARSVATGAPLERLALGQDTEVRFTPGTRIEVREQNDSRVVVTVNGGTGRFRVRHDPRRVFRVLSGEVEVEDLGTTFEVENKGSSVRVSVSGGSVVVSFPTAGPEKRHRVTLNAGESGSYPAAVPGPGIDRGTSPSSAPPPPSSGDVPRGDGAEPATPGWRELARGGHHGRAYDLLAPSAFRDVRDEPGDLLLASDAARLSQHPAEAASMLKRLLANHAGDPRAPSAAFTLGWLLMKELGKPREAALAFSRAEALAPRGNLAEDASARAVEAWVAAGDRSRAKTEVGRHRQKYPQGRHLAMLERLIGAP